MMHDHVTIGSFCSAIFRNSHIVAGPGLRRLESEREREREGEKKDE